MCPIPTWMLARLQKFEKGSGQLWWNPNPPRRLMPTEVHLLRYNRNIIMFVGEAGYSLVLLISGCRFGSYLLISNNHGNYLPVLTMKCYYGTKFSLTQME